MQKTTTKLDTEQDIDLTSDPLAGSGFEEQPFDPEFADPTEDEEADEN